jgi:hypothetical protein
VQVQVQVWVWVLAQLLVLLVRPQGKPQALVQETVPLQALVQVRARG